MTRVKICGIRRLEDAQVAAQAGADYIGLVFVPQRRRRLTLEAGQAIVQALKAGRNQPPQVVGLFADQPLTEVDRTIRECGLDLVQLCGAESLDYCRQVAAPVIRVLHVPALKHHFARGEPVEPPAPSHRPSTGSGRAAEAERAVLTDLESHLRQYREAGHMVTLDRLVEGLQGGTGQSFDWSIAAGLSQWGHAFLLAGGLTPDNVAQAIATARPWGVDVSSGVETDGVKDHQKIREFIRRVRGASTVAG